MRSRHRHAIWLLALLLAAVNLVSRPTGVAAGSTDWYAPSNGWSDPNGKWTNPQNATGAPNGTEAVAQIRDGAPLIIHSYSGTSVTGKRIEFLRFSFRVRVSGTMGTGQYTFSYSHNNGTSWNTLGTRTDAPAALTTFSYDVAQYPVARTPQDWQWTDLGQIRLRVSPSRGANDSQANLYVDSFWVTVFYDTTAPSAPLNLAVTNPGTGDRLNLSWQANAEPDLAGYNIYRSTTSGTGYTKINTSLVTGTTYTDTGLTAGTYYYVVRAVDTSGNESGNSNEAAGAVGGADPPPVPPAGLVVTDPGTGTSLELSWQPNTEPDLSGYNVYRSTTSGTGYTRINAGPVAGTRYTDTGLAAGTTYYYVVRAVDAAGQESGNSNEASGAPTVAPPPPAPPSLPAGPYQLPFPIWVERGSVECDPVPGGDCRYTLKWDPVPGAATYAVHYSNSADIMRYTPTGWEWNEAGTWQVATSGTAQPAVTLTLTPYYNYVVRVRALDASGNPIVIDGKEQTGYLRLYPPDSIPHGGFARETSTCQVCHRTHLGEAPRLMRAESATALCLTCHDGSGSKYDVLDGQIRGSDGVSGTADGTVESPAGAFGQAGAVYDPQSPTHTRITAQHSIGAAVSNAPGSGGSYSGELGCISCHNPHGTSNYRILKRVNNRFLVTVPALATTVNPATGEEQTAYFGSYNPAASGTVVSSTAGDTNNDATVTLDANAQAADGVYAGSFIRVTRGTDTYVGYVLEYRADRTAKVRVIGGSTWPAMDSTFSYTILPDPNASITTLCQSCHTSFALSRSGAEKSGTTNDGGAPGGDTHRFRHAVGIRVYQGRRADPGPFGYPGYAIKPDALHPYDYSTNSGDRFPWVVVTENQDRTPAAWADSSSTANSNRVVCVSCHVVHGTDRTGFSPVTNPYAPVTETVETGTARSTGPNTIQFKDTPDPAFPLNPRGLTVEVGTERRTIVGYEPQSRTATLESAWSVTGTPTYAVKRTIASINPYDRADGLKASTALKRRNNMGVCQSCHQK